MSDSRPLKILIVGAGIGGLTAAIGFRKAGHHVTLLETSRFSNETGAAIHIAPNCNGLLRRLGIFIEDVGANKMESLCIYTPTGKLLNTVDASQDERWEHSWLLVHRARLHSALRDKAVAESGTGKPCELRLSSRVVQVDVEKAEVTLEDHEKLVADIVIGADGVHSQCRKFLEGGYGYTPFDCGDSAFRFMIPMEDIRNDPITKDIFGHNGRLVMSIAEDRRFVCYPCNDNTVLNCLLAHPSHESRSDGQDWNQKGDKSKLLESAVCFAPEYQTLLSKVSEDNLKVWTLLDLPVLPDWVNGRMALMGDAAHPFLPHQAQGGAQAIEDAVSLVATLPLGTAVEDVEDRLQLYQRCRRTRANKVQAMTRLSGKPLAEQQRRGFTPYSFTEYNFSHDEHYHSTHALARHLSNDTTRYRQPLSFGPSPGPRQPTNLSSTHPAIASQVSPQSSSQSQTVHTIRFFTSGTYLRTLLPTSQFSFRLPDTRVQASIICCSLKNMAWLGGTGYNHCGLYIHGVDYTKRNGSKVSGTFLPILFENLTDPIITGREELGAPKWGCDIDITTTEVSKKITLGWRGTQFGELKFEGLGEAANAQTETGPTAGQAVRSKPEPDHGMLMYRYVPAVGEPGKADAEYAVFDPYAVDQTKTNGTESGTPQGHAGSVSVNKVAKSAKVQFSAGDWKALPTIHHIAKGLAELPIYEILEAKVEEVPFVGDVSGARRIE